MDFSESGELQEWDCQDEDYAGQNNPSEGESDGFGPRSPKRARSLFSSSHSFPPDPPLRRSDSSIPISEHDIKLSNQWESYLDSVQTFSTPARPSKLPWERGFANLVFGGSSSSTQQIRLPTIPLVSDPVAVDIKAKGRYPQQAIDRPGAWPIVANRILGIKWDDCKEIKRSRALSRLQKFFLESPESTGLGRSLMADILALQSEEHISSVVSDVFTRKATRTLEKRAAALTHYSLFCKLNYKCPLPISEPTVYQYMKERCSTSASKAQMLREALNFCIDTLQLDGASEAAESPRIKGFCFRAALQKQTLKQADVLKVLMVAALERILMTESEYVPDRIFAGQCTFNLHGRLRWSDGQCVQSFEIDEGPDGNGFLQANSLGTKTANTAQKKRTFLPHTALLAGITTNRWAQVWLKLREDAGLQFGEGHIPMQSVTVSGEFSGFPLEPGDASKWLRELLLRAGFTASQVKGISSHSLKATALSWCAKFGMQREHRQVLGYHVVAGSASALHYSRDEQAYPLSLLQEVYEEIRSGNFNPDATRSGYKLRVRKGPDWPELEPAATDRESFLAPKPKAQAAFDIKRRKEVDTQLTGDGVSDVVVVSDPEQQFSEVENDSSTSGSESSESGDKVDEELADIRACDVPLALVPASVARAAAKSGVRMFFHSLWCTVHCEHAEDPTKLACGRSIHAGFELLSSNCNLERPKCSV